MASHDPSVPNAPVAITEDEAAVYDRQIRLWGLEAQQRMRNATILIMTLKGVATETIKNIVLAGIGKLVVVDGEYVSPEDLGVGFFFREEDVGKKRTDAAKTRIESLNPLVQVETMPTASVLEGDNLDNLMRRVDLVCVTDWNRDNLIRVNDVCRRYSKPFYAGGTYGLFGYIFCDLINHEYLTADRSVPKETAKNVKVMVNYCPLKQALQHRWSTLTKKQTKELNPSAIFTVLAIWEYESKHGSLPDDFATADELETIANSLLTSAAVNKQTIAAIPRHLVEATCTTAAHEFSPVCAVLGGMLAQDILKALAAREPPIANFFTFDGNTGGGTVCKMSIS